MLRTSLSRLSGRLLPRTAAAASILLGTLVLSLSPAPAKASSAASGVFTASRACDAYLSFRKGTNPGAVRVAPGMQYDIREVNDEAKNWLRVEVLGIQEPLRWVAAECGIAKDLQVESQGSTSSSGTPGDQCSVAGQQDSYVLAISWQPGFCEHVKYGGVKPECDNLADGRLVVSNLTLHGLWPNRKACGTKYGNCAGTELSLTEDTVSYISPWMPNFFYETEFGKYEWKKHGKCSAMDSDTYFRRAVDSVRVVNESSAGKYLTSNIGASISKKTFYERLNADAGSSSAANAVTLLCSNKYLVEIRIRLPLDFKAGGTLKDLLGSSLSGAREADSKECSGDEIRIEASGL
jgi:ribonuclease T2